MTHTEQLLFGERLRNRRNTLKLTQEVVAGQVGITTRFYQMIERGEKSVSLDNLIKLAQVMSVSIDYLLFGGASSLENPIAEMMQSISPDQRADAERILELYTKACQQPGDRLQ